MILLILIEDIIFLNFNKPLVSWLAKSVVEFIAGTRFRINTAILTITLTHPGLQFKIFLYPWVKDLIIIYIAPLFVEVWSFIRCLTIFTQILPVQIIYQDWFFTVKIVKLVIVVTWPLLSQMNLSCFFKANTVIFQAIP